MDSEQTNANLDAALILTSQIHAALPAIRARDALTVSVMRTIETKMPEVDRILKRDANGSYGPGVNDDIYKKADKLKKTLEHIKFVLGRGRKKRKSKKKQSTRSQNTIKNFKRMKL